MALTLSLASHAQEAEFKIQGDTSRYELTNNSVRYQGNARFVNEHFKLTGDLINAVSTNNDSSRIEVSGKPAELTARQVELNQEFRFSAFDINYHLGQESINARQNIDLNITSTKGDQFIIKGENLRIDKVPHGKLELTGSPVKLTIIPKGKDSLSAQSNTIVYDQQQELFVLSGDTEMKTARETIKAQVIRYDAKNKVIDIPKSDQQVEMIQNKGSN